MSMSVLYAPIYILLLGFIYFSLACFSCWESTLQLAATLCASALFLNMLRLNCFKLNYLRHVVTLILGSMFLCSVVNNFIKYKERKTVVAQSIKSASDVVYPSITLCPHYKYEYALSKTSGTKNLTEYYESILKMSLIRKDIVEISQPYRTKNG